MDILKLMKFIEPKDLADKIRENKEKILIIDVRDSDFETAKIVGSVNVPYCEFSKYLPELAKAAPNYEIIVFHCHFSAKRGPSAAQMFEEAQVDNGNGPNILVLRGGFEKWHRLYNKQDDLYEII